MLDIEIYQAKPQDWESLKKIAITSKSYWGYSEHLILQWAQTPIVTPDSIEKDIVYAAYINSFIIGWYRLLIRLPVAILEDLWVLPDYIGKGVGKNLFKHAIQQASPSGAERLELDADPNAEPFYTRMGCQVVGESISEWGRVVPHMAYNLQS